MLLLVLLAAAPVVEERHEAPEVGLNGGLAYANGMAPGANFGITTGARLRVWRVSFGLEGAFYLPGEEKVDTSGYQRVIRQERCEFRRDDCITTYSSFAMTASLPVCYHAGMFGVCAVGVGGLAGSRGNVWSPLASAGARLVFEPRMSEHVVVHFGLQALAGILRTKFAAWEGAPLQIGLTLAVLYAS